MSHLNGSFEIALPRALVALNLSVLYTLAFIVTPYWSLAPTRLASLAFLLATLIAGTVWVVISTSSLKLFVSRNDVFLYGVLAIGLFILNYGQLTSSIPLGGDESFHIGMTLALVSPEYAYLSILALVATATGLYGFHKQKRLEVAILAFALLALGAVILNRGTFEDADPYRLLRYPYVNYLFAAILPSLTALVQHPYHEISYRIIPFFSAVTIAWLFQRELRTESLALRLAWGFAVGLIPIVLYYSGLLYLDLLAALLLLLPCLRIRQLVSADFAQVIQTPAWYALIFAGFFKENTLPFLVCFLGLRWLIRTNKTKRTRPTLKVIGEELGIGFAVLFPLAHYLFYRYYHAIPRNYVPDFKILSELPIYITFGHALLEQFGLVLLLGLAGCVFLLARKEYIQAGFLMMIVMIYPAFYLVDRASQNYIGYSRFNLYLVSAFLALMAPLLVWISAQKPKLGVFVLCSLVIANLAIIPVNIDGSKKLVWKFTEHQYPYPEALVWLKENYAGKKIVFAGLPANFWFDFYFSKYEWVPDYQIPGYRQADESDSQVITNLLPAMKSCEQCMLVVTLVGNEIPTVKKTANLKQRMIFRNGAHTLVIYRVASD